MPYCPNCGKEVQPSAVYCTSCGVRLNEPSGYSGSYRTVQGSTWVYQTSTRSPAIAAALALVLGVFGIWGIGHIYAGQAGKGIALLIAGLVLGGLFWVSILLTVILIGYIGIVTFGILFVSGWLWQAYDAYKAAEWHNRTKY